MKKIMTAIIIATSVACPAFADSNTESTTAPEEVVVQVENTELTSQELSYAFEENGGVNQFSLNEVEMETTIGAAKDINIDDLGCGRFGGGIAARIEAAEFIAVKKFEIAAEVASKVKEGRSRDLTLPEKRSEINHRDIEPRERNTDITIHEKPERLTRADRMDW